MLILHEQDSAIASPRPKAELLRRFQEVRARSEALCLPLETEDYVPQSMPDASPVKWHLAHTTWFFETFVVERNEAASPSEYAYLFNSYYNALGERIARHQRGLLTRPTVAEVYRYRSLIDEQVVNAVEAADDSRFEHLEPLITLGLNHEQQHQELLVTDLKHLLASNPIRPVYRERQIGRRGSESPVGWLEYGGGVREIGHRGSSAGFAFDNESPRHRVYVEPHQLADRLVTNADYFAFMDDGGYARPEFWLAEGWNQVQTQGWKAPLYWSRESSSARWQAWTLSGLRVVEPNEPVCHVSFFEADAFARWSGARLPTEAEWELAAEALPVVGNLLEAENFHPVAAEASVGKSQLRQVFGDVWEWTQSQYTPYPGFQASSGALGEYNGKFMCNQHVLRGGSCATPQSHLRATYRNFFPANARWQFSGLRLARDV